MKKIFILALSLIILSAASSAEANHKNAYKIMSGSVKSVTPGDFLKGTVSDIIVVDDKSSVENKFFIKPTTTLWGKNYMAINLDKIRPNDRVKVKYITTNEGLTEAISDKYPKITISPQFTLPVNGRPSSLPFFVLRVGGCSKL